jgi:ribosomal protein L7/L12
MNRKNFNKVVDALSQLRSLQPQCCKEYTQIISVSFNDLEAPVSKKKEKFLEIEHGEKIPYPSTEEVKIGVSEGKLNAVKAYKERTNISLMSAKRGIELFFELKKLTFKR